MIYDGSPVFFTQKRIGLKNYEFKIIKFRTLINSSAKDIPTNNFKDINLYFTKTGFFLRRTHLDELPQLINILMGHMSFIGPRPLLWNEYRLISIREQKKINLVKPGITGYAQISKRGRTNDDFKVLLEMKYLKKLSLFEDIKILLKTFVLFVKNFINLK